MVFFIYWAKKKKLFISKIMFIFCVEKINCHLQLVFESFQVGSLFYLSWQVGLFLSFVSTSWFFPASSFYSSQLPTLFPSFDAPSPVAVLLSNAVFSRTPVWLFGILKVWLEGRVKTIGKQVTSDWLYTFSLASMVDRHFCLLPLLPCTCYW